MEVWNIIIKYKYNNIYDKILKYTWNYLNNYLTDFTKGRKNVNKIICLYLLLNKLKINVL